MITQRSGLLEDEVRRSFLLIGRVAVVAEDPFHFDTDARADRFTLGPVDGDAVADGLDQLVGDLAELVVSQHGDGAAVGGQGGRNGFRDLVGSVDLPGPGG